MPLIKDLNILKDPRKRPAIVVVYSPECGWSKRAQETIDRAVSESSKLRGHVFRYNAVPSQNSAEIRAAHSAWPATFPGIEIQRYPTVFVFSRGANYFDVHEFKGSLAEWGPNTVSTMEALIK